MPFVSTTAAGAILADTGSSVVLVRSFVIALVVMAPVALWQWARMRRRRAAEDARRSGTTTEFASLADATAASSGAGPTLELLVAEVGRMAEGLEPGGTTVVEIPPGLTVGGIEADPGVTEAVLRDAIARSGLSVTSSEGSGEKLRLHCRRR